MHDGVAMTLKTSPPNELEIAYNDVPPALRELGVVQGTVLVQGSWSKQGVLEGQAYVFAPGCSPIPYTVKGFTDRTGALWVVGPTPSSCTDPTLRWTEAALIRFAPPLVSNRSVDKRSAQPKPKAEAKRQPKPKASPPRARPARPAAPAPAPTWSPYQWRW